MSHLVGVRVYQEYQWEHWLHQIARTATVRGIAGADIPIDTPGTPNPDQMRHDGASHGRDCLRPRPLRPYVWDLRACE